MKKLMATLSAMSIILVSALGFLAPSAGAVSVSTSRDCNSNSVIRCGISNSNKFAQAAEPAGIACLYNHFGIGSQDIANFDTMARTGQVTRSGKVLVNGKVVATNALTAGRQNMSGSTRFACGGHSFFIRKPSVSFTSPKLTAFVVMHDGRFAFAVIASCGNPVKATPVKPKQPVVSKTIVPTQTQTQTQTQTVVVNNSPPQVKAARTSRPPAATLPNTGPGNVLGISGLATVVGSLGHYLYRRRQTS